MHARRYADLHVSVIIQLYLPMPYVFGYHCNYPQVKQIVSFSAFFEKVSNNFRFFFDSVYPPVLYEFRRIFLLRPRTESLEYEYYKLRGLLNARQPPTQGTTLMKILNLIKKIETNPTK